MIFLLSMATWLSPLYPFFIMAGIAIAFDTYFGIKCARKKKNLNSRKLSRVLYKLMMYNIIVISGYTLDIYLLGAFVNTFISVELTVTKAIVFGILMTELFSIDEKLILINGKGLRHYVREVFKVIKILNNERKEF